MKKRVFTSTEIEHIILLAWADSVSFDSIKVQYGLSYDEVRQFMRDHQSPKTYLRWRTRVERRSGSKSKHEAKTAICHNHQKLSV